MWKRATPCILALVMAGLVPAIPTEVALGTSARSRLWIGMAGTSPAMTEVERDGAMDMAHEAGETRRDRDRTRQQILDAAREEFAAHGLAGARVESIAAKTRTVKRMIYYYFGSKEGLYVAVLEEVYGAIREAEQKLDLLGLEPREAIARLVAFTFDYQDAHPDFIRLVSIENIHRGQHIAVSDAIRGLNSTVVATLDAILARGRREGLFRPDVDGTDVHALISAQTFFRVANRHTFAALFGRDLTDPALRDHQKRLITDAVLRCLEAREGVRQRGTVRKAA